MEKSSFDQAVAGLAAGPGVSDADGGASGRQGVGAISHPSVDALRARFGDAVLAHFLMAGDEHVVYILPQRNVEILRFLKEDPAQQFDLLKDVTAVDYGGQRPLEVVYELWSIPNRRQLRVKATLPLNALEIDSVYDLWRTADWLEREVFDMFGIHFRGHPDLRRILMPENYAEGHPLRKDFPLRGRFSRAEQTRLALAMEVEDFYTPSELDIGGEPSGADPGSGASSTGEQYHGDPALGDVPLTERAPAEGGEATL